MCAVSFTHPPPRQKEWRTTGASGHGRIIGDDASGATVRLALPSTTTTTNAAAAGGETIHTTANHPWLTADRGWVQAGDLKPGEAVVTLTGSSGTVAWVHVVPGQADMYNLTVANDHTYAVGDGQAVVHNTGWCGETRDPQSIGFTQDTISNHGNGYTVNGNIQRLNADPTWEISDAEGNVKPIRIFQKTAGYEGQSMSITIRGKTLTGYADNLLNDAWYTLDNRRLYAYQMAKRTAIPVQVVSMEEAVQEMFKWSTPSWGIDPPILLP